MRIPSALNQLFRDVLQEARFDSVFIAAETAALASAHQDEMILGACDAHIKQAPFLGHLFRIFEGAAVGQQPFIQPDDVNGGEFQPFGCVQGEQGGRFGCVGECILVGDQRHVLQKIIQPALFIFESQLAQLQHVFPAPLADLGAVIQEFLVAGLFQDQVEELGQGMGLAEFPPVDQQGAEIRQHSRAARRERLPIGRFLPFAAKGQ